MDKLIFSDILKKYHLNKTIEQACLNIEKGKLKINFSSPNKDLVGFLETDIDLLDGEIGIYNTSQLLSLINITEGDLNLSYVERNNIITKLNIKDKNFNLSYSLSEPMLIDKVGTVNEPPNPITTIRLPQYFISNYLKARKAIGEEFKIIITFTYLDGKKVMRFILGGNSEYTNKIQFDVECEFEDSIYSDYTYNGDYIKEILLINTASEFLEFSIWDEGMLKIDVENEGVKVKYYIVQEND